MATLWNIWCDVYWGIIVPRICMLERRQQIYHLASTSSSSLYCDMLRNPKIHHTKSHIPFILRILIFDFAMHVSWVYSVAMHIMFQMCRTEDTFYFIWYHNWRSAVDIHAYVTAFSVN
jgi:hypothetical protein